MGFENGQHSARTTMQSGTLTTALQMISERGADARRERTRRSFSDTVMMSKHMPKNSTAHTPNMTACSRQAMRLTCRCSYALSQRGRRVGLCSIHSQPAGGSRTLNCLSGMYSAREVTSSSCSRDHIYGRQLLIHAC